MSSLITPGTVIAYSMHKRVKKHSIDHSSGHPTIDRDRSGFEKGELEHTERSHPVEMPVAEAKELTAFEARRPELSAPTQSPIYEILETPAELEDPTFVHTEQDNPRAYK